MNKLFICILPLILTSCAHKEIAIVVDKPTVPVYTPAEVKSPDITLFVTKDQDNNVMYSFDENNFIKLKKFLLDVAKNNEFSREIICYYNQDICSIKTTTIDKISEKK